MTSKRSQLFLRLSFAAAVLFCLSDPVGAQQDFTIPQIPSPFRVGNMYPPRPEIDVCRPIEDYIHRSSARFRSQLVTNTNPNIMFATSDSRIMSSRLESRLNTVAASYRNNFNSRLRVLKAWTPFPDRSLNNDRSLHYEGRTVQIRLASISHYSEFLRLAVEASFDWVFFETSNLVRLSVIPNTCERNIDCVFILDQSGSVGRTNDAIAKRFIRNVVSFFSIGLSQTRVGFITYASRDIIEFDLDDHRSLSSLQSAIDRIGYINGGTRTGRALETANRVLNPANSYGARPAADGIPKIAILITDGRSGDSVSTAALRLRNSGVQVYTIGIARANLNELRLISSDPDDEHVFILRSYNDALGFVDSLSLTTCEAQAIVQPCVNTISTVPESILTYFQSSCSSFRTSVLVELVDLEGSSFLYCSTTSTNPGPLTPNTVPDDTRGVTRRQCQVNLSTSSDKVYIGVRGQAATLNRFSLVVMDVIFDRTSVNVNILEDHTGIVYRVLQHVVVAGVSYNYEITEGNFGNVFRVISGDIRIRYNPNRLSSSTQPHYALTVFARQTNTGCNCARIVVNVHVFSNRITFQPGRLPNVEIPENSRAGHDIVRVRASGGITPITYSIISGNVENAFRINTVSGLVEVAALLNFETVRTSYTLTIQAASGSIRGTINQVVTISDINEPHVFDSNARCTTNGCVFTIDENTPIGTLVGTVRATDPDSASTPNGRLDYRLSPSSFNVAANGRITVKHVPDHEMVNSYSLELSVSDGCTSCSITISTPVMILINDLNDNAPNISGPREVTVDENIPSGFVVTQFSATDADSGNNALITFSLVSPSASLPFEIDPNSGALRVIGTIDYEQVQSYSITVSAANPGSTQSSLITTRIVVINLNDESPVFSDSYSADVLEHSSTNNLVSTVEATDADLGSHGTVRYSILEGNFDNSFTINAGSGEIRIAKDIDRETVTTFQLVVQARDLGTPQSRRVTTDVRITVIDENDNQPIFNPTSYSATLREDTPTGTIIFTVFASDNDEPGNPNSEIAYSISVGNEDSVFRVNASSGAVTLDRMLDFETVNSFSMIIIAADQGTPSQQSQASATINVLNVNELPPTLSGNQTINISESAPVGSQVADFDAIDPDQMGVTFELRNGNIDGHFSITGSGTIRLTSPLDFETIQRYDLQVVVSDRELETSSYLTVNVLDENEFTPVFQDDTDTDFRVLEESANGTLVGTVQAIDGDGSDMNSRVTYAFAQQSQVTQYFNLNPNTGEITTNGVLDREQLTQVFVPPASRQQVSIVARDQGSPSRQSFVTVTITLVDINDNDPVFTDTTYGNSLLENLDSNQVVFQLSATDADLGTNAVIRYSFTLNENNGNTVPFRVNEIRGRIETTQPLDCELQSSYNFTLTVSDQGTPSRNNSLPGNLNVIDENDNDPVFTMNPYTVSVLESVETDSSIFRVEATDADKGLNGEVVYSVINTNSLTEIGESVEDGLPFLRINDRTGELRLDPQTIFNYEREQRVNVTVIATDKGVPRRTGTAQVVFIIMNVDEQPPSFRDECSFIVPENTPVNQVFAQCNATDSDNIATSDRDVLISYSILSGNDDQVFTIDNSTGEIRLTEEVNREVKSSYSMSIRATDLSRKSSFKNVHISVSDSNDNAPQFTSAPYSYDFTIARIQIHKQELITIVATDQDVGQNAEIVYSIRLVTRNDDRITILEIVASDQGSPAMSTSTNLTINFERNCLLQEYSIGQSNGSVSAHVLCGIEIRPSLLNVSLGNSGTFRCNVLYNGDLTYQWIHNGSSITQPTKAIDKENVFSYTITDARFDDGGDYTCKATTSAGSIQAVAATANVQVLPIITVPPRDQAAKVGERVVFTCSAIGIPEPTIEWFKDAEKIQEGSRLVIASVTPENVGLYTCAANNPNDGTSSFASARLRLYNSVNVVKLTLSRISSPSDDGSCYFVDYNAITDTLKRLTALTTMITDVQGSNLCEVSPCMPSPCQNGGGCELNDKEVGGYQCTCGYGYTGRNCTLDIKECSESPCENGGACVEEEGGFQCTCTNGTGIYGNRCQYFATCASTNNCTEGSLCLDTSSGGSVCVQRPDQATSLVVGGLQVDSGFLDDFLQSYIEQQLISSSTTGRRKRQTNAFRTFCEPRFAEVSPDNEFYALIWLCPDGETAPTDDKQAILCTFLLDSSYVATCKPPNAMTLMVTTVAPLPDTTVTVDVIFIKPTSTLPLDGDIVVTELENVGLRNELARGPGVEVGEISAENPGRRPVPVGPTAYTDPASLPSGIVLAIIIAVFLAVVVVVVIVVCVRKYKSKRNVKTRRSVKRSRDSVPAMKLTNVEPAGATPSPAEPVTGISQQEECKEDIYDRLTKPSV